MSVRKREWTTGKGQQREAWVVDYVDQQGARRLKTFERKKEADAFAATASVEVRDGTHVADSASVTVKEAGALWIKSAEEAGLERASLDQYRQHMRLHIEPMIGRSLLSKLSIPVVRDFESKLREAGRSALTTKYVVRSLGSLLADAQERGLAVRNVVREMRGRRKRGKERHASQRAKGKLKIGVDIPAPSEIKLIVQALDGSRWRPLLLTAIFTGLRASELRGLPWSDVDLKKQELHVTQRADRYQKIGKPKTAAGERTVPLPPIIVSTLREWKLACPKGDLGLTFPNGDGQVEWHSNVIVRALIPIQIAAGVTAPVSDADGKLEIDEKGSPVLTAKYTGMHALRHFYASWCINRKVDGGLELPAKVVQHRLGHSSITVTLDTYGHLFPSGDDGSELAEAERVLLA
jgi:integrase